MEKPIILIFVGNYLPGYKAGGILRVTINTVDYLSDEFDFMIVSRDRDLGANKPYPEIIPNEWQKVGNALVYYLAPEMCGIRNISKLLIKTPHQVIFLNSFFDLFTIKMLLNRKFSNVVRVPIIVTPWGEFSWVSLKQKYPKKLLFIMLARILGLYRNVTWRASNEIEAMDIRRFMKVTSDSIHITGDFPIKSMTDMPIEEKLHKSSNRGDVKLVFLSRISREKNLDYALKVLIRVKANVTFDIYGPQENKLYWEECKMLINQLPSNISANYLSNVNPNQVIQIFSLYDLFLFPTGGEANGHVKAECLTSGTQVLISTNTPWRNLQIDQLGWDVDLKQIDSFVEVIENISLLNNDERLKKKEIVKANIKNRLLNPSVFETNRQLFMRC